MPNLIIRVPGEPERAIPVAGEIVVGRDEACAVFLTEKKASRRHLRLVCEPAGWVAEDLDSSNGTFVGAERVLRRGLVDGLVLRIGDTELTWSDPVNVVVGGRLALRAVDARQEAAPAPAAPEAPQESATAAAPSEPLTPRSDPGTRPLDMRSFGRGLVVALVGLLALVGVHMVLGAKARKASEETAARRQLSDLLARADVDAAAFESEARHYLQRFPDAPDRALLERHLASVAERARVRLGVEARFETLMARLGALPEDQVRVGLLALKRELAEDQGLAERVRLAFVELDRRRASLERAEGQRVREEAQQLLAQGLPGPALFRLTAWRAGRGLLAADEEARRSAAEDEARAAVSRLAAETRAAAEAERDPERRRRLLAAAWPGLAGTAEQEPLADALRFLSRPARTPGTPAPGPGTGPDPDTAAQALLARAAEAERLFAARRWEEARAVFDGLVGATTTGLLKQEWSQRRDDVDRVLGLVDALAASAAAAGEKPLKVTLGAGPAFVRAAGRAKVTLERAGSSSEVAWSEIEADEALALLTPTRPERAQRLALAVLAAALSKPDLLTASLAPLYERGSPGADVDALVARLLEGRAQPPEGGYRLHAGRLLDRAAYEQVLEQERLDGLGVRATELLARLEKEPVLKKLQRMRDLREELDKRRRYALLAIFNEKHYPYPYQRGRPPYLHVQAEIDRRVAAVQELWDGDEHVKLGRTGTVGKLVEEIEAALRELEAKGRDVAVVRAGLGRVAPYLTGESIRLRDFCLDEGEARLHAYNRWVREVYNPAQTGVAQDSEIVQVAVTNEYRMMIGYTVAVVPGDAAYEAIDETNVARILDTGQLVPNSLTALRAVRIDDRLVRSARAHSVDMQKRGFFDHFAPPNPATGEPRTSPFDRMRTAGYEGHGASENIAQAGGAKEAHIAWIHSSGHHRNILSFWADLGVGQAGGALWTQNFGIGGGKPPVIEPAAPPAAKPGSPPR